MRKMMASHDKMASVLVWKHELLEKQGKLASLWKMQEYYAAANQYEKMSLVMTPIKASDFLTQNNDETVDMIEIDSDGSDDDEIVDDNFVNNNEFEVEIAEGQDLGDNTEEVKEKEGGKTS